MNGRELKDGDIKQTIRLEKIKGKEIEYLGLHISEILLEHDGNYTCEVANRYHAKRGHRPIFVSCKFH